ncbi:MAG: 3-dehydroquinate synthase [Elusimicrobia bacterium]|nr:3-dehydroquinate synthase [Elusimicrobiota bacterium]
MLIDLDIPSASYQVRMGESIDELGSRLGKFTDSGRIFLLTDENVAALHLDRVSLSLMKANFETLVFEIASGEEHKNLDTVRRIYDFMSCSKLERFTPVLGFGGGVVGDLAGFVASTYLRGLPFFNAPTSLLAQVDSAVGGKTGLNLSSGKNLVGTFYQPGYVHSDVELLKTLTEREYSSGLAEVVKHALIEGEKFLSYLESNVEAIMNRDSSVMKLVVSECVKIKAYVVKNDEREEGLRRILNLGHTLGHAIEKSAGYGKVTHGEGVSIGMVFAALLAENRGSTGLVERLSKLLSSMNLPVRIDSKLEPDKLISAMELDKKVRDGKIEFVLPLDLGNVIPGINLDSIELNETLLKMYE